MHEARLATTVLAAASIDETGRQWIEVVPTAEEAKNGPWFFSITPDDLQAYAESIQAKPGRIPVDYDHADAGTRAAGWFTGDARVEGDKLLAEVEWTPTARKEIADGDFRFISPEFTFEDKDAETGLMTRAKEIIAATLTNRPFFRELAPVASLLDQQDLDTIETAYGADVVGAVLGDQQALEALLSQAKELNAKGTDMPDFTAIATDLGLADDADEAAVKARIAELKAAADKPVAATELELEDGSTVSASDLQGLIASAAKGEQAAKELRAMKVDTLIAKAVEAGKILPVQADGFKAMANADYQGVSDLLDATPEKAFVEHGSGGPAVDETDEEKEIAAVHARYEDPVTGADIHVKAMKILAEQGKEHNHTADEYVSALNAASK